MSGEISRCSQEGLKKPNSSPNNCIGPSKERREREKGGRGRKANQVEKGDNLQDPQRTGLESASFFGEFVCLYI